MPATSNRQHPAIPYLLDTIEFLLSAARELQNIAPKHNPLPDANDLSLAAAEELAAQTQTEADIRSVVTEPEAAEPVAEAETRSVVTTPDWRHIDDLVTAAIEEPRAWHPAVLTTDQQTPKGFAAVRDRLKYIARVRGVRLSIRRRLDEGDDEGDCIHVQLVTSVVQQ